MPAFLAILTFAIGLSVLWASLASNAFAVDDEAPAQEAGEATTEDANDLAKEDTYTINSLVTSAEFNSPVANCELMFYDKNWNLVAKGTTNDDGTYSFKGLDRDHAEGVVMISQDGYESDNEHIDSSDYDTKTHTAEASLTARSDANCALKLKCKDSQHQAFEFSLEVFDASDPTRVVTSWYTKVYSIATNLSEYEGTWTVSPEGVITNKYQQDDAIVSWTLKAISNEGFTLDHWTLDRGDGNKIVVLPNESFDINSGDKLWLESFYAQAPEPTPDPEPTPTPAEEVTATAQTGDSTAALPLAILAATCAIALVVSRKRA